MRQINRRDAERLIMHTMGDFRRREVRKWRFGTHFTECHDYEEWDQSIDADRVRSEYRRAEEVSRMNDVPRARSPRTTPRPSPRRASSRPPMASWTNRTATTPTRGRSSFPPVKRHPRLLRRLDHSSTCHSQSPPTTSPTLRVLTVVPAPLSAQTMQAQRWLQEPSATPVIQEVVGVEHEGTVPPAEPPTTTTSAEVTEALWQRCHDEVEARRAQRDETLTLGTTSRLSGCKITFPSRHDPQQRRLPVQRALLRSSQ